MPWYNNNNKNVWLAHINVLKQKKNIQNSPTPCDARFYLIGRRIDRDLDDT